MEIRCDKCRAPLSEETIDCHTRVLTLDEENNEIIESYFECPICGTHYTEIVTDRTQRLAIQKRVQLQIAVRNAIRIKRPGRAEKYKQKERELFEDIKERSEKLKEQYREYIEKS